MLCVKGKGRTAQPHNPQPPGAIYCFGDFLTAPQSNTEADPWSREYKVRRQLDIKPVRESGEADKEL